MSEEDARCPKCNSTEIGGGGANGMFCATCSHTWGWIGTVKIRDEALGWVVGETAGSIEDRLDSVDVALGVHERLLLRQMLVEFLKKINVEVTP